MSSSLLLRGAQFLKERFYIIPLLGACAFQASIGIFVLGHTSKNKTDVIYNRWADKLPEDRVDWTRPTQKLLLTNSTEYAGYQARHPEEEKLYQMIYGSGEYKTR